MPNNQENRKHARQEVELVTTISVDGHKAVLKTKDLSDGGAFLQKSDAPVPPVGTEVFVEISAIIEGEESMVAQARVVRVTPDGFAIVFLE